MIPFIAKVYSWNESRNAGNRKTNLDGASRDYLLNPHFMTDITTNATYGSNLKYSENFLDRREGLSSLIINKTPAQIITYANTVATSNTITLKIHPHNNPDKTAVSTVIQWANIVLADRYNPNPGNHCWVVYLEGAFKRKEVLVNNSIEDIMGLVRGNATTSTFTSVHNFFSHNYELTNNIM
jgi:hypothetical protein